MKHENPFLSLQIVNDDDDLLYIQSHLALDDWAGRALVYGSASAIQKDAPALAEWIKSLDAPFTLELGADTGIGWACLRFYTTDKSRHVACHVQFATMSSNDAREEETWRLSVEMKTEPGLIEQFARELALAGENRRGEAVLLGVSNQL